MSKLKYLITVCFICISFVSLFAQELTPAGSADNLDSLRNEAALSERNSSDASAPFYSPYLKTFITVFIIIFTFIIMVYLKQPLQKISGKRQVLSRFLKQLLTVIMILLWFILLYFLTSEILNPSPLMAITLIILLGLVLISGFHTYMKDLIAGLIIPFETQIETGYKIDRGDIQGEIVRIGLRKIELKTYDGKHAVIPSHAFLTKPLKAIYAERENCPVKVDFFLPPDIDYTMCYNIAHKSAIVSPYLFLNKPVNIFFENILNNGQRYTKMSVEASLQKIEFHQKFRSELTRTINSELNNATENQGSER